MIYILLPAYNEEASLEELVRSIDSTLRKESLQYETVIVDDGSSDKTFEIASGLRKNFPVQIIKHEKNKGLGEAMNSGFSHIIEKAKPEDVIVTMDADNTHPPELIIEMLKKIDSGSDVVIASRYQNNAVELGVPLYRRMLSVGASLLFRTFLPINGVKDYTGGYRAYNAGHLARAIQSYNENFVTEKGFSCMIDILFKLRRFRPKISEVPLTLYYNRKKGPSKMNIIRSIKNSLRLFSNYYFHQQ